LTTFFNRRKTAKLMTFTL